MKLTTKRLAFVGILAAAYAALTFLTASFAYGPVQFRAAEALTVLCCFTPLGIVGMTLGCMAANLLSFVSAWDFLIGAFATLLACCVTRRMARGLEERPCLVWLIPLPTILCNAVIVGAEIALFFDDRAFALAWGLNALSVGAGEAAVMYLLGVPLLLWLLREQTLVQRLRAL